MGSFVFLFAIYRDGFLQSIGAMRYLNERIRSLFVRVLLCCMCVWFVPALAIGAEIDRNTVPSFESIHHTIQRLPVAYQDRLDAEAKDRQLQTIATSIRAATEATEYKGTKLELTTYLISIGYHESRFRIKVHQGYLKAYSYGVWQVTPHAFHVKREQLIGLSQEETDSAALIAAYAIAKSFNCGNTPAGHFTAYYGGVPCGTKWKTLDERVNTYWYVYTTLRKEMLNDNS